MARVREKTANEGPDEMTTNEASDTAVEINAVEPVNSSYNNNLNAAEVDLLHEAQERGGKLVARSLDGLETYLYADTFAEIYRLLELRKIRPHEAVVSRVPRADQDFLF